MNIFVGNLPSRAIEDDLRTLFEAYGEVASVSIVPPRRYGFVHMPRHEHATAAVRAVRGLRLRGRALRVAPARPTLSGAYLMDVQDDFSDTAR